MMANVPELLRPLLKPHMEELTCVINPGLVTLTWTSMNIGAFLSRFHDEMLRFNELVDKLKDIVSNRLVRNQQLMASLPLVDMPDASSPEESLVALDRFVSRQEKFAVEQTSILYAKNIEIEVALKDLIAQLQAYPLSFATATVDEDELTALSTTFRLLRTARCSSCTHKSLEALKSRVSARSLSNFLFIDAPIFEVNVEMTSQGAMMNPTLAEIQTAINACARAVLECSKELGCWESDAANVGVTIFDVISRDKEVVRVVLLLTGALEGVKRQVFEYLHTFVKYDYLWRDDKKKAYQEFMDKEPSLEDFEAELKRYDLIEQEIMRIPAEAQHRRPLARDGPAQDGALARGAHVEEAVRAELAPAGAERARGGHAVDGADDALPQARAQRPRRRAHGHGLPRANPREGDHARLGVWARRGEVRAAHQVQRRRPQGGS